MTYYIVRCMTNNLDIYSEKEISTSKYTHFDAKAYQGIITVSLKNILIEQISLSL